jgi:hypothetical protein
MLFKHSEKPPGPNPPSVVEPSLDMGQQHLQDTTSSDGDYDSAVHVESQRNHDPISRVQTAQDWAGPHDPDNPHNWTMLKRAVHTLHPALFGLAV